MIDNAEEIINELKNGTPIQLSMRYSRGLVILNFVIVTLFALCMFGTYNPANEVKPSLILAGLALVLLFAFVTCQLLFSRYAEIRGKKILLKSIFGKEQEISLGQITKLSTFRLRRTIYTHLKFTNDNGYEERVLILNSNSMLFGKEVAASEIIQLAQQVLA